MSHAESAQTLHTSLAVATLGRNLEPALEIFADMVLRPHLDDDEVEPIRALCLAELAEPRGRPRHQGDLRAAPPAFPRSVGTSLAGDGRRGGRAHARRTSPFHRPDLSAQRGDPGSCRRDRLAAAARAVGRLFGDWKPRPEPRVPERPGGPPRDHILRETQQIQIALAYPAATVASPDYYRARAAAAILGGYSSARLFTEVREKRGLCYSVYASYESQLDRAAMLCYAGTSADRAQQTLDVMLAEIVRLGRAGVALDELDTMRAGLKSSLIMSQESSMSRSGSLASDWYFLGRVRPIEEIAAELDALTPEAVSEYAARLQETTQPDDSHARSDRARVRPVP